ncbi:hypothetical protein BaRGS_00018412 [Batillaria attramentaria]|uniref:Uncharacterized protein n=1 Tax=Batillaria attramentaria TaxID=370345 RepID=A0ABD0KT83_9CAEN|nr:hypothetical protein BaRGS_032341 [Batillaria attramentaria]
MATAKNSGNGDKREEAKPEIPGSLRGKPRDADDDTDADLVSLSSVELAEALADLDIGEQVRNIDDVNTPTVVETFSAKLEGETSSPLLYDVLLTSSGNYAIVTDCWNHCVKAFDLRAEGCPCRCVYSVKEHCPLCITRLSNPERVAFTLHHRAEIYVLNVREDVGEGSEDVLTFHSSLNVRCKYRGITTLAPITSSSGAEAASSESHSDRLAVTAPKEIHILSLDGEVLQVIAPALCGLPLLNDAIYLTTTPSHDLVVSDVGSRRVVCVKPSGRLRWFHPSLELPSAKDDPDEDTANGDSFQGIQWPLGVATDEAGRVLVCDLELHSVVLLSPGGAASRLLLTETESLEYPRGLHVNNGRLCLTQDDSVKVFSYV